MPRVRGAGRDRPGGRAARADRAPSAPAGAPRGRARQASRRAPEAPACSRLVRLFRAVASPTSRPQTGDRRDVAKRVLVVEDNELNLKLFCDLLRAHEFVAAPVRAGRDAGARPRAFAPGLLVLRSDERRGGKEVVSTGK